MNDPSPDQPGLQPGQGESESPRVRIAIRRRSRVAEILAVTAMLAGAGMYMPSGGRSPGANARNDPSREKTPSDLKRLEAARLKRERKAARRQKQ